MKKTLYLFTDKFPFGHTSEVPFLLKELEYLSNVFIEIILVPYEADPSEPLITDKYVIDLSLSELVKNNFTRNISALLNKDVLRELIKDSTYFQLGRIKQDWWAIITASAVAEWVKKKRIDGASSIFYSYFFSDKTIGLVFAKDNGLNIPIVSRAHRIDLYAESRRFNHFFLREYTLSRINHLYVISHDGYDYMCANYPSYSEKFSISKLGVSNQKQTTQYSHKESHLSIVSCSYLRTVKRIDLLCDALRKFSEINKNWIIQWNHFGGGTSEEVKKINGRINNSPPNFEGALWGDVSNQTIIDFYKNNEVDFFISTSESEGIPMSMMEALSFGIPIIATDVGGVKELVTKENGLLLKKGVTPEEIADSINIFITEEQHIKKRDAAKRMWQDSFSAEKNYSEFAEEIGHW